MVGKGPQAVPRDLEQVLENHGLRGRFKALSAEAQGMYLAWIEEFPARRKRRIELLVRSLRRHEV